MTDSIDGQIWMKGFPPADERIISVKKGNHASWPQLRWSFSHMQQLVPTKSVWRGADAAVPLRSSSTDLDALSIQPEFGGPLSWQQAIEATNTDGFAVLHKGKLVYENYYGYCDPNKPHMIMSCAKSFAGLIAEILIGQGQLDEHALIPYYLPELKNTAWDDASLREVLDMLVAMEFSEDYLDRSSDVFRYLRAGGMVAGEISDTEPQHLAAYLSTVKKAGNHGRAFAYREPNINVLTFIIQKIMGKDLAEIVSEMFWSRIGAEHDGYYMVDPSGCCTTFGCTLRDYLRFGEFIRTDLDIESASHGLFSKIVAGGNQSLFAKAGMKTMKGWSYKSQWWIRHKIEGNAALARGAYGQLLYIDPANELVIVRFCSSELPPGYLNDPIVLPMIDTVTRLLANK